MQNQPCIKYVFSPLHTAVKKSKQKIAARYIHKTTKVLFFSKQPNVFELNPVCHVAVIMFPFFPSSLGFLTVSFHLTLTCAAAAHSHIRITPTIIIHIYI